MTIWVWVLTYTVLGANPEHHTLSKYQTKEECELSLKAIKDEGKAQRKSIVGSCKQAMSNKNK